MEMQLIEVGLALILMYLVLALVATQLAEWWAGAFSSRQRNLELMVNEAFDGNTELQKHFFRYGPIQSLAKNNTLMGLLKGRRRPSSIPDDLAGKAFLAVLNADAPPRSRYRFPSEFVAQATLAEPTRQVLATHLSGAEADWDVFEARVTRWFGDLGDRADGWYKRRNALWMMLVSFALVLAVNADSAYVAKRLFEDDELRVGAANVAERLAAQEAQRAASAPASGSTSTLAVGLPGASAFDRAGQAIGELNLALERISVAIEADPAVAGFGFNLIDLRERCQDGAVIPAEENANDKSKPARKKKAEEWYATNSDAWRVLIPSIQYLLAQAQAEVSWDPKYGKSETGADQHAEIILLARAERSKRFQRVLACTASIGVWVRAAQAEAGDQKAKAALKSAGDALDRSQRVVHGLVSSTAFAGGVRRQFLADSRAFAHCAEDAGSDRSLFDACLEQSQKRRIPLGWPADADQFCEVASAPKGAVAPPAGWLEGWLGCTSFDGNEALELPAFHSSLSTAKMAAAIAGMLFTGVLVSLGAPFWFGLLGKVADLRAAGRVRDAETGEADARPATDPAAPSGGSPGRAGPVGRDASQPFADARNEFERHLRPQDVSRLQNALGVPPTTRLDTVTRAAIAARLGGVEELGPVGYQAITGRPAAGVVPAAAPGGVWSRGHESAEVGELVASLNRIFPAAAWKPLAAASTRFDDEVRARVVLYRARAEDPKPYQERAVKRLADLRNGDLGRVDAALRDAIKSESRTFAPSAMVGLDVALGELGITEDGRPSQSDPRVVEYLKALDADPIPGDQTAWCGAFMGWVMERAGKPLAAGYPSGPKHELLLAANWKRFGKPVPAGGEQQGDICVLPQGGSHHVAMLIDQTPTTLWLLGGNQGPTGSGAVTLVAFRRGTGANAPTFCRP